MEIANAEPMVQAVMRSPFGRRDFGRKLRPPPAAGARSPLNGIESGWRTRRRSWNDRRGLEPATGR